MNNKAKRHVSLFSGIGGFDLAADWIGWENVAHCEIDPFCQRVLRHYWPGAASFADIKQTDFKYLHGTIDIISGGFPCQPYSTAGERRGKDDPRHLWPEMLRAIREIAPRWVVGENVRGLVNWSGGLVFHEVQADLEAAGYEVLPFILPAASVGAPHERYRVWFVAKNSNGAADGNTQASGYAWKHGDFGTASKILASPLAHRKEQQQREQTEQGLWAEFRSSAGTDTNTLRIGRFQGHGQPGTEQPTQRIPDWRDFPTQSPVCTGDDGIPDRLDGITVSRHRRESIKAAGNAIVPQVAYQIFKAIEAFDYNNNPT